jgi:hypothetical protein
MIDDPLKKSAIYFDDQFFKGFVLGKHRSIIFNVPFEFGMLLAMFKLVRIIE